MFSWKLHSRLLLVLLLSVLPAAVLIGINAYNEIRMIKHASLQELDRLAGNAEADLRYAIDDAKRLMHSFSHEATEHTDDPAECSNIFANLLAANTTMTNLVVTSVQGQIICSALPSKSTINLADRDYVKKALEQRDFVVGNFIIGRISHKPLLPMALPLTGPDGSIRGLIIAVLDAHWISSRVLKQRFAAPIDALLVDKNHRIIASAPHVDLIGQSVQDSPLGPLLSGTSKQLLEGGNLKGEASQLAFYPVAITPGQTYYLILSRALHHLEGQVFNKLMINLMALLLVLVAATLLAGPLAYRLFIANMQRLIQQSHRLSLGELGTRSEPTLLASELRPVGLALDEMAASLQRKEQIEAQARVEIHKREAQLRGFLDNSSALAFMIDLEGHLLLANRTFRTYLLKGVKALPESPYYTILPEKQAQQARELDLQVIKRCETLCSDDTLSNDPQAPVYMSQRFPLLDSSGTVYAVGVIATDISERDHLERELKTACDQLSRSNRELQEFAYVASHDLQEPLRKIEAFSGRILSHQSLGLDEKSADYLQRIQRAAERMRTLINSLLTLSRISTRARPFETVNLSQLAREVTEDLRAQPKYTQAQVEIGMLPSIQADPVQMHQLFQNLLGNAFKFCKPDEPPKVSIIQLPPSGSSLESDKCRLLSIEFCDQGIGFDEKYLDKIFSPFQRLHDRQTYEGTGMGLAIVKKVIERHGGTITAHSAPGKGATFRIMLPFTQPEVTPSDLSQAVVQSEKEPR